MKKIKMLFAVMIALIVVFGFSMTSHATLTTIGTATYGGSDYNLIYDDVQSITWLDYSNLKNTWGDQTTWAAGLNGGGVLTYNLNAGVTTSWSGDWRLPTTAVSTTGAGFGYDGVEPYTYIIGYNLTNSEMGHLFYTSLGNAGSQNTDGSFNSNYGVDYGLTETGGFDNLIASYYWSGTEYSAYPTNAWGFFIGAGYQRTFDKDSTNYYALAVRPGSVSVGAVVPEPSTYLLLGSGIAGLVVWRRKRKIKG